MTEGEWEIIQNAAFGMNKLPMNVYETEEFLIFQFADGDKKNLSIKLYFDGKWGVTYVDHNKELAQYVEYPK